MALPRPSAALAGPDLDYRRGNTHFPRELKVNPSADNRDKATNRSPRIGDRRKISVQGRLTWRDGSGTLRFVSVTTRNVSDLDAFVECDRPASIPLYRLVHFQVEAHARNASLPDALQRGKVLSAVYRVGPYQSATGTPQGYALRLMVEPTRAAAEASEPLAVAN